MLKDFLGFDKMITPVIIKVIFYIAVGASLLAGLGMIIAGMAAHYGGGPQVFFGLVMLGIGPLTARVYCELLIVIFKIHESLTEIKATVTKNE